MNSNANTNGKARSSIPSKANKGKLSQDLPQRLLLVAVLTAALTAVRPASAAVIIPVTVTNTNDSGAGSLREAINTANQPLGFVDTIHFNIPGIVVPVIQVSTALPAITQAVTIDGTSQPLTGKVQVDYVGPAGPPTVDGLSITVGACTVKGLVITRFTGNGIHITGGGGNTIINNFLGTNPAGTSALSNGLAGILVETANNAIGSASGGMNLISGNLIGVRLTGAGATGNQILGNRIGTNVSGSASLGAQSYGVMVEGACAANTIGGSTAAAGNLISGHSVTGVILDGHGNTLAGNRIGVNASGSAAVPNQVGVLMEGTSAVDNVVGGLAASPGTPPGNQISGNTTSGVEMAFGASGNIVMGNLIGTNAAATFGIGNQYGVQIFDSANNTVGGTSANARNVISGNTRDGVYIHEPTSTGNSVAGDYIGTTGEGVNTIGNFDNGVRIASALGNTIGGTTLTPGQAPGNVICGNGTNGVFLDNARNNVVKGNFIGVAANGSSAGNQDAGVYITSDNNTVGGSLTDSRNVISGNGGAGVQLSGASNVIRGNLIGLRPDGLAGMGNGGDGVLVMGPSNVIGGANATDRNLISGNQGNGIYLNGPAATGTSIKGNYIGINLPGDDTAGNTLAGVAIAGASGNTVGGTEAGAGNVISANHTHGVEIVGAPPNFPSNNQILGNGIGLSGSGLATIPNAGSGVYLHNDAVRNQIGSSAPGGRNVISGNSLHGVSMADPDTSGNLTQGNYIGTNPNGDVAFGNFQAGINLNNAGANSIGGTAPGEGNLISGNMEDGIRTAVGDVTGMAIQGNRIGVNAAGNAALPNGANGILALAANLLIGGTAPGARNVISANTVNGVYLSGGASAGDRIQGNYIGVNAAGAAALGNGANGVLLENASQDTVGGGGAGAGNVISGNLDNGVKISGFAVQNTVSGNRIGTDAAGAADLGNTNEGVLIDAAQDNTIGGTTPGERNIISGNDQQGVFINGPDSTGNQVRGNRIGTDASGNAALPNHFDGVIVFDASNNTIGGNVSGAGNLISGNGGSGINLLAVATTPTSNTVAANWIGLNAAGTAPLPNFARGVDVSGGANGTIGGTSPLARNVISGNGFQGVLLHNEATGFAIQGNTIGLDPSGANALGNTFDGIFIENAPNNLVGGTAPGTGNVISGNGNHGVHLLDTDATGNRIQGNRIGTGATGAPALGNLMHGVFADRASTNTIGGALAGAGNLIAYNHGAGVVVRLAGADAILGNGIFYNDGLGIDLGADGVTPNDPLDADAGANNLQNYPILLNRATSGGTISLIHGALQSGPNTTYRIEFFANSASDLTGFGEGRTFLGFVDVATGGAGTAVFEFVPAVPAAATAVLTATATDPRQNTSEFSACLLQGQNAAREVWGLYR